MAEYPPKTTPEELSQLLTAFTDYSLSHGLTVRPAPTFVPNPHNAIATAAPVSLYPSLFSRHSFNYSLSVQQDYNALYAAVAADAPWLENIIAE
jgi:hypothetical protein